MKIGINLKAISNLKNYTLIKDEKENVKVLSNVKLHDETSKVVKYLKDENHELYVFAPAEKEISEINKLKIKKILIKKLAKAGYDINKLAVISDDELVEVAKRNYIDIMVDTDIKNVEEMKKFTDAVVENGQNADDLLEEIILNIEENRKPVLSNDEVAKGLPSEDKLWLKHYRKGDYKWTYETLSPYERLTTSNADFLDETAMEFFGKKINYKDFIKKIDEAADAMINAGIKKGDKVPVVVANTPESFITLYALLKIKATIAPIFALSTKEDFKNKLADLDAEYMFMSDLCYGRIKDGLPERTKVIVLPVGQSMSAPMRVVFNKVLKPKLGIKPVEYNDKFIAFNDFKKANGFKTNEIDTSYEDDYAAIQLFTGGTVKPKGVLLSAGNLDAASKQFFNDRFDFKRGDKIAAFMPLNHSFGLVIGTHVATSLGVNLDVIMKIDFKRLDKLFVDDKINLFGGIPTMFPAIRNNKKIQKADLSHVKYVLSGGSVLSEEERKNTNDFLKEHNSKAIVRDGYGKTETCAGVLYDGVPNMHTEIKIVKPGTQEELGYNEKGELCISGPSVMMGHAKATDNPNALQVHADGRVWLHSEDLAYIDENGITHIAGRLDRMFKVNGEMVLPDDIEAKIDTHKAIEKSIVCAKPDSIKGFVPVVFIVLNPGYTWSEELEEELKVFYKENLVKYCVPVMSINKEKFEETAAGKVDTKILDKEALSIEKPKVKVK